MNRIYIIGGVVAVLLVAILWKRIVRAIALLGGLGLAGMLVWTFAQQATATRQMATATTIAVRGSAAGNIAVVALLIVIGLFAVLCGYVALRRWYLSKTRDGDWSYPPYLQQQPYPNALPPTSFYALMQLEILRALRDLRAPQSSAMLVARDDDDDTEDVAGWW